MMLYFVLVPFALIGLAAIILSSIWLLSPDKESEDSPYDVPL